MEGMNGCDVGDGCVLWWRVMCVMERMDICNGVLEGLDVCDGGGGVIIGPQVCEVVDRCLRWRGWRDGANGYV